MQINDAEKRQLENRIAEMIHLKDSEMAEKECEKKLRKIIFFKNKLFWCLF